MNAILENVIVTRGRGDKSGKFVIAQEAPEHKVKLPQQAFDVLRAIDEEPATVEMIAERADIKTKQTKERIVRYYLPMLLKEKLVIKS